VQALTQTSKSFTKIRFLAFGIPRTICIKTAEMDTSGEAKFDVAGTGCPPATLIGDVILHSGIAVNLKLNGLYQTSKTRIILSSIFVVGIVLRIINVLLWPVYTKSLLRDFKFSCSIAKREEAQNPDLDILVDYSERWKKAIPRFG
jgi:hypothetical protein